jgi:SPP1 gp7 family putative phage head morphogenesis protein
VTSTTLPPDRAQALRAALRKHAGRWIQRFYRHEILVARTVRGYQVEAADLFRREVVEPVIRRVAGGLATFDPRGQDVTIERFPQLRAIMLDVEQIVRRGVGAVEQRATASLRDLTQQEADWVGESARRVLKVEPPPIDVGGINRAWVDRAYLGGKVNEWFDSLIGGDNGAADNVRSMLRTGLSQGWSEAEIVRSLRGRRDTGYTDGLLSGQNTDQIRTLVRSAASHVSATTRMESFKAIGVQRWRFVATLDSKTSVQCASQDGQTYPLGEGPVPPLHPNCRSTAIPDFGDPIGNRASTDGPVPATVTFADWLEGRSMAEQDEVLGKAKAAAWRSGKLPIDKMLGSDMQPLTLAELRRLDRIPDEPDDG